jgi:hypothetical protein
MHPYLKLKEALAPVFQRAGMKEISEELRPDVFGGAYSVFANSDHLVRLIWDGKDGCGYAQLSKPDGEGNWQDVPIYLTEGDLEGAELNQEKLSSFCRAIEGAVLGSKSA